MPALEAQRSARPASPSSGVDPRRACRRVRWSPRPSLGRRRSAAAAGRPRSASETETSSPPSSESASDEGDRRAPRRPRRRPTAASCRRSRPRPPAPSCAAIARASAARPARRAPGSPPGAAPWRSRGGVDQRAGARVALGRVLGDRPFDHRVEPLRHLRLGVGVLARVGDDPGQRLVEDAAERVDVGGRPDAARRATAPATCTRRCRRPRRRSRDAAVAERLGEAEVGEEGAVAFEQDVVGLDVAVDDAGGVGGVERVGDLAEQGDRLGRRQRPVARRSACAGRRPRPAASRRSARRPPRERRRPAPPRGGRGGRRGATRAGSARGSPRRSASSRAITFSATGRSSAEVGRPVDDAHAAARDQRVERGSRRGSSRWRGSPTRRLYRRQDGVPEESPIVARALAPRRRVGASARHRLPGDDRTDRGAVHFGGRRYACRERSCWRPVATSITTSDCSFFGRDEGGDLAPVGGEDAVGLRAVGQLGRACAPLPAPIRFTQRPWSRRKSSVRPLAADVFDVGRAGAGDQRFRALRAVAPHRVDVGEGARPFAALAAAEDDAAGEVAGLRTRRPGRSGSAAPAWRRSAAPRRCRRPCRRRSRDAADEGRSCRPSARTTASWSSLGAGGQRRCRPPPRT